MQVVPALNVSGATASVIGRKLAEPHGRFTSSQTAAASLIQAVPTLVASQEVLLTDQQLSDDFNDCPIAGYIVEVSSYEFVSSLSVSIQVKGRLRNNIQFWHDIGAPSYILSIIRDVYKILFELIPSGIFLKNNRSSLTHPAFVEDVMELLESHRVVELPSPPYVVNPLSVSIHPNGKKRLILDF